MLLRERMLLHTADQFGRHTLNLHIASETLGGRDLLGWTPQSLGLVSARQSLPSTYAGWPYLFRHRVRQAGMTRDEYDKLPPEEKEHFAKCSECA
jgi:hypothetical protein